MALLAPKEAFDSALVALFGSEGGAASGKPPTHDRRGRSKPQHSKHEKTSSVDDDGSVSGSPAETQDSSRSHEGSGLPPPDGRARDNSKRPSKVQSRKRKRSRDHDELEDVYRRRMARVEAREAESRHAQTTGKRAKDDEEHSSSGQDVDEMNGTDDMDHHASSTNQDSDGEDDVENGPSLVAQHESLATAKEDLDVARASRTVFLGNVSVDAITSKSAKKTLLAHLGSVCAALPSTSAQKTHKVESIRFRSTAFASQSLPKKAAYVRKEVMRATTPSTNAYVVYSTPMAAREAVRRLNGRLVLDRHVRVDSVAHPTPIDHRRCVFVGNLGFVDDESNLQTDEDAEQASSRPKKKKPSADVEEGLWRQFGQVGTVESVRVVRDAGTRVGKGIAYVQFTDANAVEAALLFHDKKFPPMLPRQLRVARAKKPHKATSTAAPPRTKGSHHAPNQGRVYVSKVSPHVQSLQGRAHKLLGRAGAAQLRRQGHGTAQARPSVPVPTDGLAWEGHRARRDEGRSTLQSRKSGSGRRKPRVRTRSTAWKKAHGSKGKKT